MHLPTRTALLRFALVALVLGGCVACDQLTKSVARQVLPGTGSHSFLGDTLRLEYAENPGAFLNLGDSLSPPLRYDAFIVGVGIIVVGLLAWAALSRRLSWPQRFAIAAMAAGGLGNVIDRIRFGVVSDFLNMGVGPLRTGIFNVADVSLLAGVIVLLLGRNRHRS